MYDVFWQTSAVEQLMAVARLDWRVSRRILAAALQLERTGTGDLRKLAGTSNHWRLRVGDFRIQFIREGRRVTLLSVLNRRDAYDD